MPDPKAPALRLALLLPLALLWSMAAPAGAMAQGMPPVTAPEMTQEDPVILPGSYDLPKVSPGGRAAGMGNAAAALSAGTSSVYNNPAGMAQSVMFAVEGLFQYVPTGNVLSASIMDSETNSNIAAGIGVDYYFSRGEDRVDVSLLDLRLGLAIPVVANRVAVGVMGHWVRANVQDVEIINGFALDAGAFFSLAENIRIGLQGKNLLDPCEQTNCKGISPLTVGGGLALTQGIVTLAADLDFDLGSRDDSALIVEAGLEAFVAEAFPLRLGYRHLGLTSDNVLTGGFGWRSKTAGLDVGYQHDLALSEFDTLILSVSAYF